MQCPNAILCLAALFLALPLLASPVSAQSSGEGVKTIGITAGKIEEIMPETLSGFALAAERGHLKVPDNRNGDNSVETNPSTSTPTNPPTSTPTILIPVIDDPCQIETSSYFHMEEEASYYVSQPSAPMAIQVPFVYEVETNMDHNVGEMNEDILPKIEQAIGDGILPILFDHCAVVGDGSSVHTPFSPTDGNIMGITTSPPDVAIFDAGSSCSATQSREGNNCTVVDGILTIYVAQTAANLTKQETDALVSGTQEAIREVMNTGALNDGAVDESVEAVTYGRDGPHQEPIVTLGTGQSNPTGGGYPIYIAIAGSAVVVGAVLMIVGAKMRSQENDEEAESESDEESGIKEIDYNQNDEEAESESDDESGIKEIDYNENAMVAATVAESAVTISNRDGDDNSLDDSSIRNKLSEAEEADKSDVDESTASKSPPVSPEQKDALNRIDAALNSGGWAAVLSEANDITDHDDSQSVISDIPNLNADSVASSAVGGLNLVHEVV